MNILWLNAGLLLPLDKGGKLRTWHVMRHLAARHDITYLSFEDSAQTEADRLGIDYKNGRRGLTRTANSDMPYYAAKLARVRIGDVQVYDVVAIVSPAPLPYILLGKSFLTRFQMKRENDIMTLDLRY